MPTIAIELFGMPGCGKSYVARHLADSLEREGYRISDRTLKLSRANPGRRILGKIGLVLRALLPGLRQLPAALALVSAFGTGGIKRKMKLVFNWLYLCALIRLDSRDHQILVLDQGLAQGLWSTLFSADDVLRTPAATEFMEQLMERLPIDYLSVIHVDADAEITRLRLAQRTRGNSPLDRDLPGAWQRATRITAATRAELERVAALVSNFEIVDFSNSDDGLNAQEFDRVRLEMTGIKLLQQARSAGLD